MLYPSEEQLYAAIDWLDCSAGFEDIRYHKSNDVLPRSPLTAHMCVMRSAH